MTTLNHTFIELDVVLFPMRMFILMYIHNEINAI